MEGSFVEQLQPGSLWATVSLRSHPWTALGTTFLGIFEIKDANSMRICYDLSGAEFPKEFNAPKGTQFSLVGYRRQSDSTPASPEHK